MSNVFRLFSSKAQDEHTFTVLLRPHIEVMFRMAYRWTRDEHTAEDLLQECLIKLASRVDELQAIENLRPWLIKVLYRGFVDDYRSRARKPVVLETELQSHANDNRSEFQLIGNTAAATPALEQQLSLQDHIQQALDSLPEMQQQVVLLHDLEGYTAAEIAEILEIPAGTVKSRLHRAREELKKILGDGTF